MPHTDVCVCSHVYLVPVNNYESTGQAHKEILSLSALNYFAFFSGALKVYVRKWKTVELRRW
jgi:hypothetical protein